MSHDCHCVSCGRCDLCSYVGIGAANRAMPVKHCAARSCLRLCVGQEFFSSSEYHFLMHMLFACKLAHSVLVLLFRVKVPCLQARSRFSWFAVLVIQCVVLSRRRLCYPCVCEDHQLRFNVSKKLLKISSCAVLQLSLLTQTMVRSMRPDED